MKIFALTVGDKHAGSTQYRLIQYLPFLVERGCDITIVPQDELSYNHLSQIADYDLVINQKCLIKSSWANKIVKNAKHLIFDYDDAIYTRPGKPYSWWTQRKVNYRLHYWLRNSDTVITANNHLADCARSYKANTEVLPMALDINRWKPLENSRTPGTITIGWAGAPHNLRHLLAIEESLAKILHEHPQVKIAVLCGTKPNLRIPYEYHPYIPDQEPLFTQQLDIGLLPLIEDEFSLGKSPIKAIQYLSCGVPVVGNVFGATAEILDQSNSIAVNSPREWFLALQKLVTNPSMRKKLGKQGQQDVQHDHNLNKAAKRLWEIIKD
ncbi:MAG: glycosyltransferase family 4 protein [Chlamydiota bacterium]